MGPQGSRAGVMAKDNQGGSGAWMQLVHELFKMEVYKRSQGRLVRQFTCLAIWVAVALAAYRTYELRNYLFMNLPQTLGYMFGRGVEEALVSGALRNVPRALGYVVPTMILLVGLWSGFRIVNLGSFADFLIAVEAEMNKVSWPSRTELIRASMVVIVLMFGLTIVLFTYDFVLNWLLSRVLQITIV
jgi:preprotein translocase subunit SecE